MPQLLPGGGGKKGPFLLFGGRGDSGPSFRAATLNLATHVLFNYAFDKIRTSLVCDSYVISYCTGHMIWLFTFSRKQPFCKEPNKAPPPS